MRIGDLAGCVLLTIAVTATCVTGEDRQKRQLESRSRKVNRRDTTVLIDTFPMDSMYNMNPKIILRRGSRHRYGPPKSKYGPPKPKYGPPPKARKPAKKYRKHTSSKYGPPPKASRSPKPRYGPPKRQKKPVYGPPKKPHSPMPQYYTPEPVGFAEPPPDYEHQPQKQSYGEPPVDSYGAPLKALPQPLDPYPTSASYNENPSHFETNDYSNQEFPPWQNYPRDSSQDSSYAYSKKRPMFVKPEELFDVQATPEEDDFHGHAPYDFNYHSYKEPPYSHNRKPQYFADSSSKNTNKYWKAQRPRPDKPVGPDEEIVVGGQYAEPPARYVPKFQPSAPMYGGDNDFAPIQSFVDPDVAATSATISPYVNYKNSNMAFSPQNLNDAFSIVDK